MPRPLKCPRCGATDIYVQQLKCNYSAFNGYHHTPSDYSLVRCSDCNWPWRTKSDQVYQLPRTAGRDFLRSTEGRPSDRDSA